MHIINEFDIKDVVKEALLSKVADSINHGQLHKLIDIVVLERSPQLEAVINKAFDGAFADKEFEQILISEFKHKIAKTLVSKLEGTVEKSVNEFTRNPIIKAKLILAIENIINGNDK